MSKKLKKNCLEYLIKFHEWINKRVFLLSFILTTSSLWYSLIIGFFGEYLRLIYIDNGVKKFTIIGGVFTIFFVLFSLLNAISQRYYEYKKLNNDSTKRKLYLMEQIDVSINKICENKYKTLMKILLDVTSKKISPPLITTRPDEQIKQIIDEMCSCISVLLSDIKYRIKENELYISLYYNFPKEDIDKWYIADSVFADKGESFESLISNNKSTLYELLNNPSFFLFYNSKEQATRKLHYIPDNEDKRNDNGELKGSIACYEIIIDKNNEFIKAVLSISTYSKRFINSDNETILNNVEYNLQEYVLDVFKKRLNIELCLLYINHLYENSIHSMVSESIKVG